MGRTFDTGFLRNVVAYDANGNVGLGGAVDATYKLKVTGAMQVTGAATFSSSLRVGGATGNFIIDTYTTSKIGVRSWTDIAGTTNNFFVQNSANFNYGVVGVVSATGGSTGDVYALGYTPSAGTSMTPVINWTSGGNVGIGTSSPSQPLHVYTTATTTSSYFETNSANSYIGLKSTSGICYVGNVNYALTFEAGGSERMRILPSGSNYTDICIGTSTSSYGGNAGRGTLTVGGSNTALYALQVGGANRSYLYADSQNTYLDNATGTGDIVVVNGTGGVKLTRNATSWVSNSDERLKNINSDINNALDKLLTLRAVNFSWKSDETNAENLGLIAQDVEAVFPQVIHKSKLVSKIDEEQTDETEYLGVRYTELIPVLVKAIQESHQIIKDLEARIAYLENK